MGNLMFAEQCAECTRLPKTAIEEDDETWIDFKKVPYFIKTEKCKAFRPGGKVKCRGKK
jgi:hypothetical protein